MTSCGVWESWVSFAYSHGAPSSYQSYETNYPNDTSFPTFSICLISNVLRFPPNDIFQKLCVFPENSWSNLVHPKFKTIGSGCHAHVHVDMDGHQVETNRKPCFLWFTPQPYPLTLIKLKTKEWGHPRNPDHKPHRNPDHPHPQPLNLLEC